jgi:cystathionine gamma-synthase
MTHASVALSELAVPDDLIRLSVGLESVEDLLADLEQALRPDPARTAERMQF